VCEEAGFSKIHIFPFSPRHGTPAAEMPQQVPADVKAERCRRLAELETVLRQRYYAGLVGRRLAVLIEGAADAPSQATDGANLIGTSCRYAPVTVPSGAAQIGDLATVTATRLDGEHLVGKV
jgi:threonylcarbamoyladenosine tRNA methylthiotransferase MtaB